MTKLRFELFVIAIIFLKFSNGEFEKAHPRKAVKACQEFEEMAPLGLTTNTLGGDFAELGEFPHMAGIGYRTAAPVQGEPEGPPKILCGGTLIAAKFVLTAARCAMNGSYAPVSVRFKVVDFSNQDEMKNAVEIPIKKVYMNDNFKTSGIYNDIAILELEREVEFSHTLRPACLYTESGDPPADKTLYVTGWGARNITTPGLSNILQKTLVKTVPLAQCNETYAAHGILNRRVRDGIIGTQLCALSAKNGTVATCRGDSGGPMSMIANQSRRTYQVIGVVSAGVGCGTDIPDVYTRISAYIDWIENVVWPGKENSCQCVCPK